MAVAVAARGRRRVVHRLVQRLPHAADGRLAQGSLHGPDAQPRDAPLVSSPDGSFGVRSALDRRHPSRKRRAGRTSSLRRAGCRITIRSWSRSTPTCLGAPVGVHPSKHGPALGAAILGVLAAGKEVGGSRTRPQPSPRWPANGRANPSGAFAQSSPMPRPHAEYNDDLQTLSHAGRRLVAEGRKTKDEGSKDECTAVAQASF